MKAKQIKFLSALLQSGKITEACKLCGISNSTAYRWLEDPEFKTEMQKKKTEMLGEISTKMQVGFSDAVENLLQIIRDPKVADQVKINAIDCLFRNARPLVEEVDILNRLQTLEEVSK